VGDPAVIGVALAREQRLALNNWLAGTLPEVAEAREVSLPTRAGTAAALLVRPHGLPPGPAPALLYLHGGGFAFGDLATHERLARNFARECGAVVLLLDYRRTPEHRYPAALEDALDAFAWLNTQAAELGIDPARTGLLGDSAGGTLALATARALTDADSWPARALGLIYPMASMEHGSRSHQLYGDGSFGLTTKGLEWFWRQYLRDDRDHADPLALPGQASLANLPPIALFIAECDALADDSWRLAERLEAARHPHSLEVFTGMTHAFIQYDAMFPPAAAALATIGQRMRALLAG
jgi:acetyl esterase